MKKTIIQITTVLFLVSQIIGCSKTTQDDTKPTVASFNKLMDEGYKSLVQTTTFDASNTNFVFTSSKGTKVTIDGSCLRKNGNPVTGQVSLEFFEAFNRVDMAIANKPTMGKNTSGEFEPLISGGQFFIFAKQDGIELTTTCKIAVSTPSTNLPTDMTGMSAWDGVITDGKLTWEPATKWEILSSSGHGNMSFYPPGFGRFNCDKFYNDPRPKTEITVLVPEGYGNISATGMFMKSIPNSMGGLYGKFPIGLDCHLIFVTEKNGMYQWIIKETSLVANHTIAFNLNKASTGTRADYDNALRALN